MQQNKYQILIAYSQKLFSDGLKSLIENLEDFIMKESVPFEKLEAFLKGRNSFDIVILELNCPTQVEFDLIIEIKKEHPQVKSLLISNQPNFNLGSQLIESCVDAYLLKSCSGNDFLAALYKIGEGKYYFCPDIVKTILGNNSYYKNQSGINLTQREEEILKQLVDCKTNAQIAKDLFLSENTVKTHRKNILMKFGTNNIIGMIRYACRSRLLDYGPDGFCKGCPNYN